MGNNYVSSIDCTSNAMLLRHLDDNSHIMLPWTFIIDQQLSVYLELVVLSISCTGTNIQKCVTIVILQQQATH